MNSGLWMTVFTGMTEGLPVTCLCAAVLTPS